MSNSRKLRWLLVNVAPGINQKRSPMAGRGDKIKESMDTVVAESGVALDTRLLGENIIVLTF